jgi:hypothetical protein
MEPIYCGFMTFSRKKAIKPTSVTGFKHHTTGTAKREAIFSSALAGCSLPPGGLCHSGGNFYHPGINFYRSRIKKKKNRRGRRARRALCALCDFFSSFLSFVFIYGAS